LFQKASTASRGVKTRTAIGHAGRSVVRLALQLASSRISDWSKTHVLLIGTGAYAATTVAALRDRGVQQITVFSPSGRAAKFAARLARLPGRGPVPAWPRPRSLLVGSGAYAATTVASLRDRGVQQIAVFSPSGRAAKFAARLGLVATEVLSASLAAAGVVITCTSRPEPVVTPEVLHEGERRLVVDPGLPRNVDPAGAH